MKHPKRFCVTCNKEEALTIRGAMYHCQVCGDEVCRVGDGDPKRSKQNVRGLDVRSIPEDVLEGANLLDVALGNPDVLSDEHAMWQPRDPVEEAAREDNLRTFKVALAGLTARQAEVLQAVDLMGSHDKAADYLGIARTTITETIRLIKNKVEKKDRHIP